MFDNSNDLQTFRQFVGPLEIVKKTAIVGFVTSRKEMRGSVFVKRVSASIIILDFIEVGDDVL